MTEAVNHCRREQTPVLVPRLLHPSLFAFALRRWRSSTSPRPSATPKLRAILVHFPEWLLAEGILDAAGLEQLKQEVDA